jgi:hypothetical protein
MTTPKKDKWFHVLLFLVAAMVAITIFILIFGKKA